MIIVMFGGFLIESYIWSNNEIGLVIVNFVFGIYFVIIMVEDGCELVELVQVVVLVLLVIDSIGLFLLFCVG